MSIADRSMNSVNADDMLFKNDHTPRLLIPFTRNIQRDALEYVIQYSQHHAGMLVALACIPEKHDQQIRYEDRMQARDFSRMLNMMALQHCVAVERYEVVTNNVAQTILHLSKELCCDEIVLFPAQHKDVLLDKATIAQLRQENHTCPLRLVPLSSHSEFSLLRKLASRG